MTKVIHRADREPGFDRLLDFGERLCRSVAETPASRLRRRRVCAAGRLLVCQAHRGVCFRPAFGVVTEMPDGPRKDDLMLVPAGGTVPRRMNAAAPETVPA
ncbi:MAG: hypothetical protein JOZ11_17465 [Alphaproteobacteria bacterium]|nr:hypothetical protein [Alphaproteobacteria bacterium]